MVFISGRGDVPPLKRSREEKEHKAKMKLLTDMHSWQKEEHLKKMEILNTIKAKIEKHESSSKEGFSVVSSLTNLMNL